MPTTYKVLGQTSAVAPSTSAVTTNFIKDPSFNLYTNTTGVSAASVNTNFAISAASNFWTYSVANTTDWSVTYAGYFGVTPPFGGSNTAFGFYKNGTGTANAYLSYGQRAGIAWSGTTIDITKAIPVTAGLSYYLGATVYAAVNTPTYTRNMIITWYDSAGAIISNNSTTLSLTTNTWVRTTSPARTAPTGAVYAGIHFIFSSDRDGTGIYVDGVAFSTSATLPTTFVEPVPPTTTLLTAPFDKKTDGYNVDGTFEAITTLSYAGPLQTLYTVPAGSSAVVSTITVSDMTSPASTYRIAIVPSGATLAAKHFISTDLPISGNSTVTMTLGITLAAGDSIRVAADDASIQFSAFGSEIS